MRTPEPNRTSPASVPDPDLRIATLDATAHLLATEGATNVTVRRIAEAARCSTMSVYHYFGDKAGLLAAVYAEGHNRLQVAQGAAQHSADPEADVRNTCLAYRDVALTYPDYFRVTLGGTASDAVGAASAGGEARAIARSNYAAFVDVVRRWSDAQPLTTPAEDAAYSLWAAGHGMVMLELSGQGPQADRARHYAVMIDSLMRGLRR